MNTFSLWFSGLRAKLLVLVLTPTLVLAGLVTFAYLQMQKGEDSLSKANLVRAPIITHMGSMDSTMNGIPRWIWATLGSSDVKERENALKRAQSERAEFIENQKAYLALPSPDKMKELYKPIESNCWWKNASI